MSSPKTQPIIPERAAAEIIKHLEHCTAAGHRPSEIFDDWLEIVELTLTMEPTHYRALRATGHLAADPPAIVERWQRVQRRYPPWCFESFARALAALKTSAQHEYRDTLGEVYMAWGSPSAHTGQFFTPFDVALAMAQMTINPGEVHERLKAAIAQSPAATAALLTGALLPAEQAEAWLIARVIPLTIEHYTPLTICDPAVGSGVMLLATAAQFPRWAVQLGLVQFYGQDIDRTCVQMCTINCMLYGLNGWFMAETILAAEATLAEAQAEPVSESAPAPAPPAMPEPPPTAYEQIAFVL